MAKLTVDAFAQQMKDALGDRLISLLLYGSAARGAYVPERSDFNTLLICDRVDETLFARLEPPVRAWLRAGQPAPLILTEREWRDATDAFPIEYEDMREANRLLAGRDPWGGITIQREHVRRQLESEVMGKLVQARRAYVALRDDPKQLTAMLVGTAGGFFAMLRAALRLAGTTPPADVEALVRDAGARMGFDAAALQPLAVHTTGGRALVLKAGDPLPGSYVAALAATAAYVNRMERKDS
jgi:predicted nucleotidyltransferase